MTVESPQMISEFRGEDFQVKSPLRKFSDSDAAQLVRSALAGMVLLVCYFPIGWGSLGWVALVPLLALVRVRLSTPRWLTCAFVAGTLFYWPALQWMRVADPRMYATWAALSVYCTVFFVVTFALIRRLDRRTRLPLVVTVPVVWTASEYLRAHLLTGFPWYFLGHTQHEFLAVIQVADVAGAYAVTFLVAAVNALVFEFLCSRPWFRRLMNVPEPHPLASRVPFVPQVLFVVALLAGALAYGSWRLGQTSFTPGPRVALLQGNLDIRISNDAFGGDSPDSADRAARTMVDHYLTLSNLAMEQPQRPRLIVWPETSCPGTWREEPPGVPDADARDLLAHVSRNWPTDSLLGLNSVITTPGQPLRRYNSALLISPSGKEGRVGGRYDKIHRVPFGEYVPFEDYVNWFQRFAPYDFDYSVKPGEHLTRFALGDYHFGVLICYEDTDPVLARRYCLADKDGPPVDFLVNISNDGWFNGTSEHEQHLAICRFRAIETRRAVVRSVNMGVSAVIDGNGRVLEPWTGETKQGHRVWEIPSDDGGPGQLPSRRWKDFKKVSGVLSADVPLDRRASLYAAYGDWFPVGCWAVLLFGVVRSFVNRKGK